MPGKFGKDGANPKNRTGKTPATCPPGAGKGGILGRHNQVAFGEAVNLVGPQRDFGLPPGKQDVGMVALLLSQGSDSIHKVQGLLEVRESEGAGDVVLVDHLPVARVGELLVDFGYFLALVGADPAPAW